MSLKELDQHNNLPLKQVLHQIAEENQSKFLEVCNAIVYNNYVDDICTDNNSNEQYQLRYQWQYR